MDLNQMRKAKSEYDQNQQMNIKQSRQYSFPLWQRDIIDHLTERQPIADPRYSNQQGNKKNWNQNNNIQQLPVVGASVGRWWKEISFKALSPSVAFHSLTKALSIILTSGTLAPLVSFASELEAQFNQTLEAGHVVDMNKQVWVGTIPRLLTSNVNYGQKQQQQQQQYQQQQGNSIMLQSTYQSTRDQNILDAYGESLLRLVQVVPAGMLVFFCSFSQCFLFLKHWKRTGMLEQISQYKRLFVEPRNQVDQYHGSNNQSGDGSNNSNQGNSFSGKGQWRGRNRGKQQFGVGQSTSNDKEQDDKNVLIQVIKQFRQSVIENLKESKPKKKSQDSKKDSKMKIDDSENIQNDEDEEALQEMDIMRAQLFEDDIVDEEEEVETALFAAKEEEEKKKQKTTSGKGSRGGRGRRRQDRNSNQNQNQNQNQSATLASSKTKQQGSTSMFLFQQNSFTAFGDIIPLQGVGNSKGGALLFAVCRGKVSEGINFADDMARCVVLMGIPFPSKMATDIKLKMDFNDQEYQRYLQQMRSSNQYSRSRSNVNSSSSSISSTAVPLIQPLTGNEWYSLQATRAANQALGRVIRHRADYGALILLDSRFHSEGPNSGMAIIDRGQNQQQQQQYGQPQSLIPSSRQGLSKWFAKDTKEYHSVDDATESLKSFFQKAEIESGKIRAVIRKQMEEDKKQQEIKNTEDLKAAIAAQQEKNTLVASIIKNKSLTDQIGENPFAQFAHDGSPLQIKLAQTISNAQQLQSPPNEMNKIAYNHKTKMTSFHSTGIGSNQFHLSSQQFEPQDVLIDKLLAEEEQLKEDEEMLMKIENMENVDFNWNGNQNVNLNVNQNSKKKINPIKKDSGRKRIRYNKDEDKEALPPDKSFEQQQEEEEESKQSNQIGSGNIAQLHAQGLNMLKQINKGKHINEQRILQTSALITDSHSHPHTSTSLSSSSSSSSSSIDTPLSQQSLMPPPQLKTTTSDGLVPSESESFMKLRCLVACKSCSCCIVLATEQENEVKSAQITSPNTLNNNQITTNVYSQSLIDRIPGLNPWYFSTAPISAHIQPSPFRTLPSTIPYPTNGQPFKLSYLSIIPDIPPPNIETTGRWKELRQVLAARQQEKQSVHQRGNTKNQISQNSILPFNIVLMNPHESLPSSLLQATDQFTSDININNNKPLITSSFTSSNSYQSSSSSSSSTSQLSTQSSDQYIPSSLLSIPGNTDSSYSILSPQPSSITGFIYPGSILGLDQRWPIAYLLRENEQQNLMQRDFEDENENNGRQINTSASLLENIEQQCQQTPVNTPISWINSESLMFDYLLCANCRQVLGIQIMAEGLHSFIQRTAAISQSANSSNSISFRDSDTNNQHLGQVVWSVDNCFISNKIGSIKISPQPKNTPTKASNTITNKQNLKDNKSPFNQLEKDNEFEKKTNIPQFAVSSSEFSDPRLAAISQPSQITQLSVFTESLPSNKQNCNQNSQFDISMQQHQSDITLHPTFTGTFQIEDKQNSNIMNLQNNGGQPTKDNYQITQSSEESTNFIQQNENTSKNEQAIKKKSLLSLVHSEHQQFDKTEPNIPQIHNEIPPNQNNNSIANNPTQLQQGQNQSAKSTSRFQQLQMRAQSRKSTIIKAEEEHPFGYEQDKKGQQK
ncbi:MAG: putative Fanconi anemia group J protein [Streblomastix strix]|uniref:Putative Fanconi anemia group J protein n=1 Tax=Streblomastix strix TaxID=222440 RepID=A0A5J4WXS5_9EUKA|nr:MAG: putative Fanconi anemia group J protein [Streblomastix strix]